MTSPWQGKAAQAQCRQGQNYANRCAGKISPDVRELRITPRHPQLAEFEQCAISGEQQNELHRRHAMMARQAKGECGD